MEHRWTRTCIIAVIAAALMITAVFFLAACGGPEESGCTDLIKKKAEKISRAVKDEKRRAEYEGKKAGKDGSRSESASENENRKYAKASAVELEKLEKEMPLKKDFRDEFDHGEKGEAYQKYIVLHDTEGSGDADTVITGWVNDGRYIAAHFIVNKDGTVVQCVPVDRIGHHAGFGNTGHNKEFGVDDESRDDKRGTKPLGSDLADYGMNSFSVGIEMVHIGGETYPEAQLEAVDKVIAYIDAYFGNESIIIDHKMWRNGNSDTSAEFAGYLENYRDHRTHD